MTDLAKSALNCAWALSVYGVQEALRLMNPGNLTRSASEGAPHPSAGSMDAKAASSPFSMMGPLDPLRWLDMGTRVMQQMAPAQPADSNLAMPSVLESMPGSDYMAHQPEVLHFDIQPAPPAEQPRPAATGWGPMP